MSTPTPCIRYYHGYGQTGITVLAKNAALFKRLQREFDIIIPEGAYNSVDFHEEIGGLSWWPTDNIIEELQEGLEINVDQYLSVVHKTDVLMGFSQGGNLILRALEKDPSLCKVAVICNALLGNIKTPIKTPTILVFGEQDRFVDAKQREKLIAMVPNHEVILTGNAHCIAQNAEFCKDLIERIKKYL